MAGLLSLGSGSLTRGLLGLEHRAKEVIPNTLGDLDQFALWKLVNRKPRELALDLLEGFSLHLSGDGQVLPCPVPHHLLPDALDQRPLSSSALIRCRAAQDLLGLSVRPPVGPLLRPLPSGLPLTSAVGFLVNEVVSRAGCLRHGA